jgi:hypothetical protein
MERLVNGWKRARAMGRRFGPYVVVEALMPGGTLLALLLYAYRQRKP